MGIPLILRVRPQENSFYSQILWKCYYVTGFFTFIILIRSHTFAFFNNFVYYCSKTCKKCMNAVSGPKPFNGSLRQMYI